MTRIYVDHAASSPIHPKVIEKMMDVMNNTYGNPSSTHYFGRQARQVIDGVREKIAESIHADANEIIFTGSGTEADNLAIFGIAETYKQLGKHIITTQIEHHAVLHACQHLEKQGYEVTYLPVDETGLIHVNDVKKALRDDTILVTIMFGNNEVGTIQPIKEIGALLHEHQAKFHTDAVQAFGLEKIDVKEMRIDLLSVAAHKINGPKGIGFLYAQKDLKLSSRVIGGDQERKRRAGTENVPYIAGFGEAVRIVQQEREKKRETYQEFKCIFLQILQDNEIEFLQNGSLDHSLPHVLNLSFPGTNLEATLVNLDLAGIAASSGSACTAGTIDPSHVLVAMFGKGSERLQNSIRFSFGLHNTEEEIVTAAKETVKIIKRLTN
ncbi:cysteine desulfurase [Bacillus sp. Bva_UNVM-123]|uniref:cysteine desulfurase family protein n=1 Tax=Bacillus sp. Bva_UNVM-123 TaxID=2829798 RepID=UPI00391F1E88